MHLTRKDMVSIIGKHFDMTDRGVRKMASENPLKYDDYLRACLCDMAGIKTEDLFAIVNEGLKTNKLAEYIRLGNIMERLNAPETTWIDEFMPPEGNEVAIDEIIENFRKYGDGKFLRLCPERVTTGFGNQNRPTSKVAFKVYDTRSALFELDTKTISLVEMDYFRLKTIQNIEDELSSYLDTYSLKKVVAPTQETGLVILKVHKFDLENNSYSFEFWDKNTPNFVSQYKNEGGDGYFAIDGYNYDKTNYLDILKLVEKYDPANLAFFKTLTRFLDDDELMMPGGDLDGSLPNHDAWSWLESKVSKFSNAFRYRLEDEVILRREKKAALMQKLFESFGIDRLTENMSYEFEVAIGGTHEFISAKRI